MIQLNVIEDLKSNKQILLKLYLSKSFLYFGSVKLFLKIVNYYYNCKVLG